MSGISSDVVLAVARVATTFAPPASPLVEHPKTATGFWVGDAHGRRAFVLNKHSVWPSLAFENPGGLSLAKVAIEIRVGTRTGNQVAISFSEKDFLEVSSLSHSLVVHETADCAALIDPEFKGGLGTHLPIPVKLADLADQAFLAERAHIMDLASFVGYPGAGGLWDEGNGMPIARLASLASLPAIPFTNSKIGTSDVGLVAGLSFGGSSGSPLWLHAKPGVPPRLLGLMSGHGETTDAPESKGTVFAHMGLSWFTRSTSVLELLTAHGFQVG
jgi:hypothetical protein